jgi:DNA-binding NarL/FixJ family response regulator
MLKSSGIEVVIIEDHDPFREMLSYFLTESHGMECRSFTNVRDALKAIAQRTPDIVIMDIHLPDGDGISGTKMIRHRWPGLQVIICTVHEDDEKIFNALRAGATGYLLKRAPLDQLVQGIHNALEGGSPISPAIARRVIRSFQDPLPSGLDALTMREREVLDLLAMGLRVKAIRDRLSVSESTIRTHAHHIYEKMQVRGRLEMMNRLRGG